MSDILFFGLSLLTTASLMLVIYSGHASERGMVQGMFFVTGKAMIMGFAGLLIAAVITFIKDGFVSLLIIGGLSMFIFSPIVLSTLKHNAQIFGIFGFWIGLAISLFTTR
jgi:hypothetical protein